MTTTVQTISGVIRKRFAAWVKQNPERRQISERELCSVYQSRRIPAPAIADAVRAGFLRKSNGDHFEITVRLIDLCVTEAHSTLPPRSQTNTIQLTLAPPDSAIDTPSEPGPSKIRKDNLVLKQLSEKYRTPRRQNVVSRNYRRKPRSPELSTDLSTPTSQILSEAKYLKTHTGLKSLNSHSQKSEDAADSSFPSGPKSSEFADVGSKSPESLVLAKSLKSLALPCFKEYPYPKDKEYDEETLIDLNTYTNPLNSKLTNARARGKTRANSVQRGKKTKIQELQAQAKQVIKSSPKVTPSKPQVRIETDLAVEADNGRIYSMAAVYEDALQRYRNNPYVRAFRGTTLSDRVRARLLAAAKLAEELKVSYETYIKAHFWAFDRWYNSKPNVHNLCAQKGKIPSKKRVKLYLEAVRRQEITAEAYTHGSVRPTPTVSLEARFQNSERQLKRFMKNYSATEAEILCRFATKTTANLYFDREWLRENETYQRLLHEDLL